MVLSQTVTAKSVRRPARRPLNRKAYVPYGFSNCGIERRNRVEYFIKIRYLKQAGFIYLQGGLWYMGRPYFNTALIMGHPKGNVYPDVC
jgi:hypothetical protein